MNAQPSTEHLTRIAVAALEDIKAKQITTLDVRHLTTLFDTMIIANGDSSRQVKALAEHVRDKLKEAGAEIIGTEGAQASEWILVDAGGLVINVMHPAVRQHYNLEELWDITRLARAAA